MWTLTTCIVFLNNLTLFHVDYMVHDCIYHMPVKQSDIALAPLSWRKILLYWYIIIIIIYESELIYLK